MGRSCRCGRGRIGSGTGVVLTDEPEPQNLAVRRLHDCGDRQAVEQHARRVRRAVHQTLEKTTDGDAVPSSRYALGAAAWHGMKDGKQRIGNPRARELRK